MRSCRIHTCFGIFQQVLKIIITGNIIVIEELFSEELEKFSKHMYLHQGDELLIRDKVLLQIHGTLNKTCSHNTVFILGYVQQIGFVIWSWSWRN